MTHDTSIEKTLIELELAIGLINTRQYFQIETGPLISNGDWTTHLATIVSRKLNERQ